MAEKRAYEAIHEHNEYRRAKLECIFEVKLTFSPGCKFEDAACAMYELAIDMKRTPIEAKFNGVNITMTYDGS